MDLIIGILNHKHMLAKNNIKFKVLNHKTFFMGSSSSWPSSTTFHPADTIYVTFCIKIMNQDTLKEPALMLSAPIT